MQEASLASAPSAQLVGNAFVEQYYHILHESPQLVHRFYQDSSSLCMTDVNGNMVRVTTMQVWYHGNKLLYQVSILEISLLYGLTWIGQLFLSLCFQFSFHFKALQKVWLYSKNFNIYIYIYILYKVEHDFGSYSIIHCHIKVSDCRQFSSRCDVLRFRIYFLTHVRIFYQEMWNLAFVCGAPNFKKL